MARLWDVRNKDDYKRVTSCRSSLTRKNLRNTVKNSNFDFTCCLLEAISEWDGFLGKEIPYNVIRKIFKDYLKDMKGSLESIIGEEITGMDELHLGEVRNGWFVRISFYSCVSDNSYHVDFTVSFDCKSVLSVSLTGAYGRYSEVNILDRFVRKDAVCRLVYNLLVFCSNFNYDIDMLTVGLEYNNAHSKNEGTLYSYYQGSSKRKYYVGFLMRLANTQNRCSKDRNELLILV